MELPDKINLGTKAIVYRIMRILIVLFVSLIVLGDVSTAISISMIDAIIATIYYYYFDKYWDKYFKKLVHKIYIKIKYRKLQ